ncbi:hypothetical protein AGMMS49928_14740 [Spirochaetia bacterium]|nr:hypothetical protein AGMMS49928_14740 [Spirochaetia bacterium]
MVLLRPLRENIYIRMMELRDGLIGWGEEITGLQIEYASIGPSIFGTLDIRNIRLKRSPDEPVLSVSRLRISYSLWQLIRKGPVESLRSIRVDRPHLSINLEKDRDLLDLFSSSENSSQEDLSSDSSIRSIVTALNNNVRLSVRNGSGEVIKGRRLMGAGGVGLDAVIRNGRISFQGKWDASVSLGAFLTGASGVMISESLASETKISGRISGDCAADLSGGSATLAVPLLGGDLFQFRPLTVKLSLNPDSLEIRKINDRIPFDISLDYDLASRLLTGTFQSDNFLFSDLLSLQGAWAPYNHWLATKVSGRMSMEKSGEEILYMVDVSGLAAAGPGAEGASFAVKGRGNPQRIAFEEFSIRIPEGDFTFRGFLGLEPLAPNGYVTISNLSITGDTGLSAGFNIITRGREISLFGENISAGSIFLPAMDLSVTAEDSGITFAFSGLRFREMESFANPAFEEPRLSRFSLEGSFDYDPRNLRASLLLEAFSIQDMMELIRPFAALPAVPAPAAALVDSFSVTTEIFITTDFEHVSYNAPRLVMAYEKTGGGDVIALASLSGTDRRFELLESRFSWGKGQAEVAGFADFSNFNNISFSLRSSYLDYFYEVDGLVLDQRSISIRGSYGLQIYLGAAGPDVYSGFVSAHEIPLPYPGGAARLSFFSSINLEPEERFWSVDISNFEVLDLATPGSPAAVLRFSGEANQDGVFLEDIYFDDSRGILRGRLNFSKKSGGGGFEGRAFLSNASRQENYELKGTYDSDSGFGSTLSAQLAVTNIQLARFFRNSYNSAATGKLNFVWNADSAKDPQDSFYASLQLESLTGRFQDRDFHISAGAFLDKDEFSLQDLQVNYAGLDAYVPQFRLERPSSLAAATVRVLGTAAGRELDLGFTVDAEFAPVKSLTNLPRLFDSVDARLSVLIFHFGDLEAEEPFDFHFTRSPSRMAVTGGPRDMIRFMLSGGGEFYAAVSSPSPVRGTVIGTIGPQTIAAQSRDLYVDLVSLWNLVPPRKDIGLAGGYVTASLEVSGSLTDPEFYGSAHVGSMRLQVPGYIPEDICPIPLDVSFEGNEARFGPVPATVGFGAGDVSGWFRFERWIPNTLGIDIQVPPESPIPMDMDITGILVQGLASGNIRLGISDMIFSIAGDITAQETEVSLNADELTASLEQPNANENNPVAVNLNLKTGKKVEFIWPNKEIAILQAYADMGSSLKILNDPIARRYSLEGNVKLRGGEILYAERSFYIREGALIFRENEILFDPRISARAEIRDRSSTGPVTISMIIDNAPLRSFTARFESNPALSQLEIFSLLGQTLTGASQEGDSEVRSNASFVASGVDVLTHLYVIRRLERGIRDFLSLDMFSFRTQVVQNVALQAWGGLDPVDRKEGIGNYFDNTTVFIGKYFGPDMFTQFMLSARYDEDKASMGGLTFEPDFGIELHSPLFDIRWNFVPLHPENMFVNDQFFTLMWRWSL